MEKLKGNGTPALLLVFRAEQNVVVGWVETYTDHRHVLPNVDELQYRSLRLRVQTLYGQSALHLSNAQITLR